MSFAPLPGPFLDEAGALASRDHAVLELGCGAGDLTGVLRGLGLAPVALDRVRPLPDGGRALLGDALAPPVREGSCDLVVAGNLLRHLAPRRGPGNVLAAWAELVGAGGALWVFEDAPRPPRGPAGNFGRLHGFLQQLDPQGRGPLLTLQEGLAAARNCGLDARGGHWENTWPLDPAPVLALLRGGDPRPGGAASTLAAAIAAEGLACGPAWWLRVAGKVGAGRTVPRRGPR